MRHGILRHVLAVAATLLAAGAVSAQSPSGTPPKAALTPAQADHQHLDMDLVAASREQCDMAAAALAELSKALDAARKADTLATAKSALETTRGSRLEVLHHLGACSDIMKMLATSPEHTPEHDLTARANAPAAGNWP